MRIRIFGIPSETGIGVHSTSIFEAIKKIGSESISIEWVSKYDEAAIAAALQSALSTDVNIFFFHLPKLAEYTNGINCYWYVFETTKPHFDPKVLLEEYDYLISPSRWGRDCLLSYGAPSQKVVVVPEGVNPWLYAPYERPKKSGSKIKFLMVGKYEKRKGYAEVFKAFDIAYKANQNIELWVKADWINELKISQINPECISELRAYPHLPIYLIKGVLTSTQIRNLYLDADYFICASKGEGWGLPLIEAIACGTPVICCEFGGQSEYLGAIHDYYIPLPYQLGTADMKFSNATFFSEEGQKGMWAEINSEDIAKAILYACKTNQLDKSKLAADIIRAEFSWEISAIKLLNFIFTLNNKLENKNLGIQ